MPFATLPKTILFMSWVTYATPGRFSEPIGYATILSLRVVRDCDISNISGSVFVAVVLSPVSIEAVSGLIATAIVG